MRVSFIRLDVSNLSVAIEENSEKELIEHEVSVVAARVNLRDKVK